MSILPQNVCKGHSSSSKVTKGQNSLKNYLKIQTDCHHVNSLHLSLKVSNDMYGFIQNM